MVRQRFTLVKEWGERTDSKEKASTSSVGGEVAQEANSTIATA